MKTINLVIAILFAAGLNSSRAQGTWTQKADFGGAARQWAIGFNIGDKGYLGTGANYDAGITYNDFWEYNPSTNVWTQKADFGGTPRAQSFGFSIDSMGYVCTGGSVYGYVNDFWQYNPIANTWTQKANYGGIQRDNPAGFSIAGKGYVGTGWNGTYHKDFWEYNPSTDTWTQKTDFPGSARDGAVGFAIGNKGYIGTGVGPYGYNNTDFYEYDPSTNTWTQKANFGGTARNKARGFSINGKGYIGTGYTGSYANDFWEYDPSTDIWTQKANLGSTGREGAIAFCIGNNGYIGTGDYYGSCFNDFWEYTPGTSSCAVPANLSATNITSTSAQLKWDANPAIGYKVKYKIANASGWTIISTSADHINISGLSAQTDYAWRIRSVCSMGPRVYSAWSDKQTFTTGSLRMGDESLQQVSFQIYPNPAEDHATIQFTLPQSSHVYIGVYDVSGKEIETLLDGDMEQGEHLLLLSTNQFSKGVYLIKLISDFGIENQKLIVQ